MQYKAGEKPKTFLDFFFFFGPVFEMLLSPTFI